MGFYDRHILPRLINCACGVGPVSQQRAKVVPAARGTILEVGMGSGLNLPFYAPARVDKVWGLEPSADMRKLAAERVAAAPFEVEFIDLPGEAIPLEDQSVDTVLLTYTLCTIPDPAAALQQMHRVLKPEGQLIFCEHGEAPDAAVRRWQARVNPFWCKIAGGCNLHRPIPALLEANGFHIDSLDSRYLPGTPRIAGFNYWGVAR